MNKTLTTASHGQLDTRWYNMPATFQVDFFFYYYFFLISKH